MTLVPVLGSILALQTLAALGGFDSTMLKAHADVTIEPSEVEYVEARYLETVVRGRPWVPYKRLATIGRGTRLRVRGEVESRDNEGCRGKPWYAVLPFGFVCSEHVKKTDKAPAGGSAMPPAKGRRVPHSYAIVRYDGVPQYANSEMVLAGLPERELTKSMTLVARRSVELDGMTYIQTRAGKLVPRDGVGWMGQGSQWRGVMVDADGTGPLFAWARKDKVAVLADTDPKADRIRTLAKRERVSLLESSGHWRRIGEGEWVDQGDLNEVIVIEPPEGVLTDFRLQTTGNDQWIDVDVGEQVLVAYRGADPVYATIVSSGRGSPTPLGNYPIWAKVASMDMANQDYEDKPYMVQGVPWVLLFQGHNALHGAYWHDRFGNRKSHGCVNLAPLDAYFVFDWVGPTLPSGWTGFLPPDLQHSPVVHVRDSSRAADARFTQQRKWGPPDRAAEDKKAQKAERRREAAAAAAALEIVEPSEPPPPPPPPPPAPVPDPA